MNIESAPPLVPGGSLEPLMALQFGSTEGFGRPLMGPERDDRDAGAGRMPVHDVSPSEVLSSQYLRSPPNEMPMPSTSELSPPTQPPPPPNTRMDGRPPGSWDASGASAIEYFLDHSDPSRSSLDNHPLPTEFRASEGSFDSHVTAIHQPAVFPWNNDPHEPRTSITGGTFIGGNINHIQRHGELGLYILYRVAANDAAHDSGERYPQPRCHPETGTTILHDINAWSSEQDPSSSVLWLHGPAGAGKSAIAQSLCQTLEEEGRLGGSFFFKRGHASRGNGNKLFPTIAYQLALRLPELKRAISQRMEDDPSITHKSLSLQLQKLIVEPCRDSTPTRPFTIIIDGLDECEGEDIQQEILRSIGRSFHKSQPPLRFLVASRPEPHIGEVFREPGLQDLHRPFNIQQSFDDLKAAVEVLKTEKSRLEQAWQTVSAEKENAESECKRLNAELDRAEAEIVFLKEHVSAHFSPRGSLSANPT
ncbi:hypothetical protein B0H17DRAFT_670258 [Mycena rosella]|uniref:Nephrocystin 3-like N-terminal domain-containing protein n=1 Tax=Mycena rosella TaxID=1033263 RepID=A0AAD7M8E0_MYCRO|nr:hypothetical protein B0H17DRAFT_670258 [Mycena rosella]